MKIHLVIPLFFLILSCNPCPKDKNYSYRETRLKSSLVTNFIPTINGKLIFQSDSGSKIIFDQISLEHNFITGRDKGCEPENCCHNKLNYESKRLLYVSNNENLVIQFALRSGDTSDYFIATMSNWVPAESSEFASSVRYADNIDFLKIIKHTATNLGYVDSLSLRDKIYKNVYIFQGNTFEQKKFAKNVYYKSSIGLIGFKLNDNTIWAID